MFEELSLHTECLVESSLAKPCLWDQLLHTQVCPVSFLLVYIITVSSMRNVSCVGCTPLALDPLSLLSILCGPFITQHCTLHAYTTLLTACSPHTLITQHCTLYMLTIPVYHSVFDTSSPRPSTAVNLLQSI